MSIIISHSYADGTLVDGTHRGDGAAEVLRTCRLRWSRALGMWYVRNSRDNPARQVDMIAAALRAAAFDVVVNIDDTPTPIEEREAARADRAAERQAGLAAKADRLGTQADASRAQARQIADMIPMGQPILLGHHSERRHRRDLDRHDRAMRASFAEQRDADEARRRAAASARELTARQSFVSIGRRLDRLEADRREHARRLARATGDHAERIAGEAQETARQLDHWRARRAQLIASGQARDWKPSDFQIGDHVIERGHACTVVRINPSTLTLQADVMPAGVTSTARYYEITAHHRPASPSIDSADAEATNESEPPPHDAR